MPLRHEFVKGCQEFQYHPWSSSRLWQGREVLKELMLRNLDYSKKKKGQVFEKEGQYVCNAGR